ncbi:MAG TPA: methyltransferase domain-containing protein [Chitinophagaceae bacterium]|nr:methyltransferase domain-containing protein [Chitinophagaceae bacterium]
MSSKLTGFFNKLRRAKQAFLNDPSPDPGAVYDCPVCGAVQVKMHPVSAYYFGNWQKYQTIHNPVFIETMNLAHYMCARCFSFDRERLYALYLKEYFCNRQPVSLLDIAPGKALKRFLKNYPQVIYRSMDLEREDVDDRFDITDMKGYKDEQFDFFICSHVLEHIPDDIKAMQELHRVLKKGGKGIAMVPISLQLEKTMEDPGCTDEAMRWKYFFQNDHVRMYAKEDFINRLRSVGFTVEQLGIDHFSREVFEKNAISPTSVLYVVSK